ncbi:hypothetical protein, partial [Sphingomonas sp. CCH9-E2]|uniref:hypothetical protein n=1 Tax=Sphingomonas sp. CCH9-E2 TaxID=1768776 RepID=UPI001E364713
EGRGAVKRRGGSRGDPTKLTKMGRVGRGGRGRAGLAPAKRRVGDRCWTLTRQGRDTVATG